MSIFKLLKAAGQPFETVVQIGAHTGEEVDPFREAGVKRAIMIEAADAPYAELCAAIGDAQDFIPVKAVCSSLEGEPCDFYVASFDQASSMLKPKRHLKIYKHITFEEPVRMTTRTVDSVVAEVERSHPGFSGRDVDLMYIDTQGAELKVLMGATRTLQFAKCIFTEVSYDLYEGGATLEEQQAFLAAFGFRLHYVGLKPKAWGDALFVKRP